MTNYCATAGTVVTTDSTTSSLTSTTSLTSLTSTTSLSTALSSAVVTSTGGLNGGVGSLFTATVPSLTFSTVSSSTASSIADATEGSSSQGRPNGPTTVFQSGQNVPFPTQTKSTNAFANAAESRAGARGQEAVALAALAIAAGGWMLA